MYNFIDTKINKITYQGTNACYIMCLKYILFSEKIC